MLVKSQSKRLPGKNTLPFNGEPMFVTNLRKCLKIFDETYVSSDSGEILAIATREGARVIKRGLELCGDTPNIPVYQHAIARMDDADGIVAVQANSPTIDQNLIALTKSIMESGAQEVMTMDERGKIYGSIWAISKDKLLNYDDYYDPHPDVLIRDTSVDVHTKQDLSKAIWESMYHA